jgi:hypothetical protein
MLGFSESKEKYQTRVLRDFPWLWGIRNDWLPGSPSLHLSVTKELSEACAILNLQPHEDDEMWMHFHVGSMMLVRKVEKFETKTWRDCIFRIFFRGPWLQRLC